MVDKIDINNPNKIWHFVYPYKMVEDPFGWELKYSIRSIYKNFKGKFHITVIGDIPDWIDQSKIRCIELNNININAQRQTKINQKIMKATELYDDFILMNDDQYIMRTITPQELIKPRRWYNDVNTKDVKTIFKIQVANTIHQLELNGNNWRQNMVSHCPFYYESDKLKELNKKICLTPMGKVSVVLEVAYFNYFKIPALDAKTYRIGCYGEKFTSPDGCYIFNHNEKGYLKNKQILSILQFAFLAKSPAEK